MNKTKYYAVEITHPETNIEVKFAQLFYSAHAKLLLEDLTDETAIVEFSGVMRFNANIMEEDFDGTGSKLCEPNIIEITSAKKGTA